MADNFWFDPSFSPVTDKAVPESMSSSMSNEHRILGVHYNYSEFDNDIPAK